MGRNSREQAEATREKIIHVALDLYSQQGYSATSFVNIANELGLSKGAVHNHFPSKKDLLFAVMDYGLNRRHAMLRDAHLAVASLDELQKLYVDSLIVVLQDEEMRKFEVFIGFQMEWSEEMVQQLHDYRTQLGRGAYSLIEVALGRLKSIEPKLKEMDVKHTSYGLFVYWQGAVRMSFVFNQSVDEVSSHADRFFNQYMMGVSK
ncbi:TetR/AcrR family transcriptional regulator [Persicirhabdus sediminis]|uniref:TetR/AcrR family transcriptional regulator n=1 Tax=Persicirhabdus sediminis TaxID=454144 RepID=A0A8J7MIU7_9BACT|nr:TetR family transcriptional regulator [Persicirhabdus sediminis]MBK1792799.1 TetR/AcrR family transcriptional regulator [Persicirhabdus sediminis]